MSIYIFKFMKSKLYTTGCNPGYRLQIDIPDYWSSVLHNQIDNWCTGLVQMCEIQSIHRFNWLKI